MSVIIPPETMADVDLNAVRDTLVELARQAGRMMLDASNNQSFSTDTKMNGEIPTPLGALPAHSPPALKAPV